MTKKKLLFVDDEQKIRTAFARTLRRSDYDVDLAASGAEALEMMLVRRYAVVVTDLRMPGMDGLALMVRMRAIEVSTTFVVITGAPDLDLKADDRIDDAIASVIAKPWEDNELYESLALAFELQETRVSESKQASHQMNILVVDNDDERVSRLCDILSPLGIVSQCNRLEAALTELRGMHFDVVVTRLALPDARGLDTVTRIQRANPRCAVVVSSDVEDMDIAIQAMRFGAQDYLHLSKMESQEITRALYFAYERKQLEHRLTELAHYDNLTGLANRMTLRDRLSISLAKARRHNESCALLYIDLDFFKPINDTYGHEMGDIVLQHVATRMQAEVRDYDTVARLGGDEFAVLLEDLGDEAPDDVANRILQKIRIPIQVETQTLQIGASGGLAVFPQAAETIDALVRCADKAMYLAKSKGRNRLQVYESDTGPDRH